MAIYTISWLMSGAENFAPIASEIFNLLFLSILSVNNLFWPFLGSFDSLVCLIFMTLMTILMSATCKNKKSSYVRKGERSEPNFFSCIFVGDNKNNKISVLKGERSEPKIFVLLSKNELLFNISAQYVIVLDILYIQTKFQIFGQTPK